MKTRHLEVDICLCIDVAFISIPITLRSAQHQLEYLVALISLVLYIASSSSIPWFPVVAVGRLASDSRGVCLQSQYTGITSVLLHGRLVTTSSPTGGAPSASSGIALAAALPSWQVHLPTLLPIRRRQGRTVEVASAGLGAPGVEAQALGRAAGCGTTRPALHLRAGRSWPRHGGGPVG